MTTPLTEFFRRRSVPLLELSEEIMVPQCFTDRRSEYFATRRRCGLFDFSFMACVEIAGRDSLIFLQRLQTRNLSRLPPGRLVYSLMLRPDGTVLNDITVWRLGQDHYCLFSGRHADIGHMHAMAREYEVSITDRSHDQIVLAVQGVHAWRVVSRCLPDLPASLPYYGFCDARFEDTACRVARIGYSGEPGYELIASAECGPRLWQALFVAGADCGLAECGFEAVDSLRIEAGHILFARELAAPVDPLELGLSRLLDFYHASAIGMDALRARRWSEPTRRLVGLIPERADMTVIDPIIIMNDSSRQALVRGTATLTSACLSPILDRPLGLGFVTAANRYPGTQVKLRNGIRARVARLPFYDPAKRLVR